MIFKLNGTETVDGCLWRNQQTTINTEAVLVRNPHLCKYPIIPPFGIEIDVPEITEIKRINTINLWD